MSRISAAMSPARVSSGFAPVSVAIRRALSAAGAANRFPNSAATAASERPATIRASPSTIAARESSPSPRSPPAPRSRGGGASGVAASAPATSRRSVSGSPKVDPQRAHTFPNATAARPNASGTRMAARRYPATPPARARPDDVCPNHDAYEPAMRAVDAITNGGSRTRRVDLPRRPPRQPRPRAGTGERNESDAARSAATAGSLSSPSSPPAKRPSRFAAGTTRRFSGAATARAANTAASAACHELAFVRCSPICARYWPRVIP